MSLDAPHIGFVLASYGAALAIILGLILWVLLDGRARRAEIRALEAAGIRRRSDRPVDDARAAGPAP
ncbi:heme exporter protein CcmD [Xaviernesmea oryzae]|uniref:Heme exporter protein D n=1 Tax=Xaviernesmea oryzae TaxID=464029 RepID=A0A1Q9AXN2_9HYPH|nr:heme exporter protein CcmD [Xaviernesmea oryzae]OLP60222.1 heme exporter protein CcmD [Xaviernesmea oryzae]SEK27701.1 heme exporter protein CcmD [Xaviernesmea oryzae]